MKRIALAASLVTAIALVVNAVIHFMLAGPFDGNPGTVISQGGLFRIEAVVDILAALVIVVRPRLLTALAAAVVAAGGLGLLLFTVYLPLDLSFAGGPLIFEPAWYQDKITAALAQAIALVAALVVLLTVRRTSTTVRDGK
ncbi:MAG: hypothetical protein ABJB03_05375 [Rhodoglobus sp.]